jgi:hypothetical protein
VLGRTQVARTLASTLGRRLRLGVKSPVANRIKRDTTDELRARPLSGLLSRYGVDMDWGLIVTAIATSAVASAVIAITQAMSARRSERDAVDARNESRSARDESVRLAGEANAAFRRSADATEKLAALEEEKSKPPIWSGPRHVTGDLYQMVNTSGRSIVVDRIEIEPDEAAQWFSWEANGKAEFAYGDSFDFMTTRKIHPRVRRIDIHWRYADEVDGDASVFVIPF